MNVRQLSVYIDSQSGSVSEVTKTLGDAGIDIRGFSVAETVDYGIVRLVVDDPETARAALDAAGLKVKVSEVLCIKLPDVPGGLAQVLAAVAAAGVHVEHVYSLISTHVVLTVADPDRALALLKDAPVKIVSQEAIADM